LINKEGITPQEILDLLLYKYQNQIILTVFNNLKGRDNPSIHTSEIIHKLKEIRFDYFDKVISNYISTANPTNLTSDVYSSAENELIQNLDNVIYRFEEVDEYIAIIDSRNTKYHTSALAKLNFLINSRRDVEGLIDRALIALKEADVDADYEDIIEIYSAENIDDKSLYSRTFNRNKVTNFISTIPEVSESEIEIIATELFREDEYSKSNISCFVKEWLNENPRISSKSIVINDVKTLIMLMMVQLYAEYDDVGYEVRFSDDKYVAFGYVLQEFEIISKEKTI
jgi:hypothetical protein